MLVLAVAALLGESILSYPAPLFRLIGHPVIWIGSLIAAFDRRFNGDTVPQSRRRLNGVLAVACVVGLPAMVAWALATAAHHWLPDLAASALTALAASTLLAQRSLHAHVAAVAGALRARGLEGGREAVSQIVGRDPHSLDEAAVLRAAIESLAENFSDGVVAPLFWCALLGLPGIVAYKAINTADSMIGHLTPRHRAFGWAAARLDDLVNLPASRLAALWIILAAGQNAGAASRILFRDAGLHASPNAGWPEAAMAGALGIRLAGPRAYDGVRTGDSWIGDGARPVAMADLQRGLALYRRACIVQLTALALLAWLLR